MNSRFCNCKDCIKLRKRGLVLGTRQMGFWMSADRGFDPPQYYLGPVSDYIPHPKFQTGRRPVDKFNNRDAMKDY